MRSTGLTYMIYSSTLPDFIPLESVAALLIRSKAPRRLFRTLIVESAFGLDSTR